MSMQDYAVGDIIYYTQKAQYRGIRQVRITKAHQGRNGQARYYTGEIIAGPNRLGIGESITLIISHMTKNYEVALRRLKKQVAQTKREYAANRVTMERYENVMESNLKAAEEMLV